MNLPGGMTVRYKCVGCGHKMEIDEHARNLTTEKVDMGDGFEHTMTVILCDTCKPVYDDLRKSMEGDALDTIAAMPRKDDADAQG